MYGFALLKFQLLVDKEEVSFPELRVTKAELVEEYKEVSFVLIDISVVYISHLVYHV
jgi:hypothetical protein